MLHTLQLAIAPNGGTSSAFHWPALFTYATQRKWKWKLLYKASLLYLQKPHTHTLFLLLTHTQGERPSCKTCTTLFTHIRVLYFVLAAEEGGVDSPEELYEGACRHDDTLVLVGLVSGQIL